jgi:trk system potassium uptake protein TrkA
MHQSDDRTSGKRRIGYAVIVGSGRLGSALASALSRRGVSVVVIDTREEAFELLPPDFSGFTIVGDAAEASVLREAKIEKADCFCATAAEDNLNLLVAQLAKHVFKVPVVVARLFDPSREAIYRQFDIVTVSPTQLAADAFLDLLSFAFADVLV